MARIIYKNFAGKRIPSVTTILAGLGWNKDALVWWANNEGLEGRDCRESSKHAMDVGTVAHRWIEANIKKEKFNIDEIDLPEEDIELVKSCYKAFLDWKEYSKLQILESEVSLISEKYQFGGTMDAIGYVYDRLSVLDFKTSKAIYEDYLIQLSGYMLLVEENKKGPITDIQILRLGKEDGSFTHRMVPVKSLKPAIEVFLHLNEIYKNKRAVTKLK